MDSTQPPVGIDLGTTFSAIAYVDSMGSPVTITNALGRLLTPSAVLFDDDDIVIGEEAIKSSIAEPSIFADCFKREMGKESFRHSIRSLEIPPEVISAFVLERLSHDAEQQIGPVKDVVITVPAFFDEKRRWATQVAGQLAGLNVLDIINEPTAAAIAHGYQHGLLNLKNPAPNAPRELVVIYDLGGGTFDVSIVEIEGKTFRVVATDGDIRLGGRDFDERLVDHIAERFVEAHGLDPRTDLQDAVQLWIAAEQAKHTLSARKKSTVTCTHAGIRMNIEITRKQFEDLIRDLIGRTEMTITQLLRQARLQWPEVARVLLVGGSTRIPMVSETIERLSGIQPDRSLSPDHGVAHGAALYAAALDAKKRATTPPPFELVNVNSHSLGIVGLDTQTGTHRNVILIPRNTPLPAEAVRTFKTAKADQRSVVVRVLEGESRSPDACIRLGQCIVSDLTPGLPAGTDVEVSYKYAANGRISITARMPGTRESAAVEFKREQSERPQTLDEWKKRLMGGAERSTPLQELDSLYLEIGRRAVDKTVPKAAEGSQKIVSAAQAEVSELRKELQRVQGDKRHSPGISETIRLKTGVSQLQSSLRQAETRLKFATIVLGRDCVDSGFKSPGCEQLLLEIVRLRKAAKKK